MNWSYWVPNLFPADHTKLLEIGPFSIRYYALAYIVSILLGWQIMRRLVRRTPAVATELQTDDFLTWATLGIVLGGRLGYVLFYQPSLYLAHPLEAFAVWDGGMSFHGGALGVVVALILYCRQQAIPLLGFADRIAVVTPMGLGIGRMANFVNGELWGIPAPDWLPWAMVFPKSGDLLPRHPSQIYQALMEGLILFCIMLLLARREAIRARFGVLTGVFLVGYAIARSIGELFREPDRFLGAYHPPGLLGDVFSRVTMGQALSTPMLLVGVWLIVRARPRPAVLANA